ncbi:hypothetical protein Vretimale_838, partial [Volvox reticuliferus]
FGNRIFTCQSTSASSDASMSSPSYSSPARRISGITRSSNPAANDKPPTAAAADAAAAPPPPPLVFWPVVPAELAASAAAASPLACAWSRCFRASSRLPSLSTTSKKLSSCSH